MPKKKRKLNKHKTKLMGNSSKESKVSIYHFSDKTLEMKLPINFFLVCCDCGLTHQIVLERSGKDKILMALQRDESATDLERENRRLKKRLENAKKTKRK